MIRDRIVNMLPLRISLFVIATLGLLVSAYLTVTYVSGAPIPCGAGHGCDVVRASPYAAFFGVPTPIYGVVFYLLLAVSAILATPPNLPRLRPWLIVLTAVGVAVSAYLTYLEAFVIEAWCRWCLVSAALAVLACMMVLGSFWQQPVANTHAHDHQ